MDSRSVHSRAEAGPWAKRAESPCSRGDCWPGPCAASVHGEATTAEPSVLMSARGRAEVDERVELRD